MKISAKVQISSPSSVKHEDTKSEHTNSIKLLGVSIWNGKLEEAASWLVYRAKNKISAVAGFVNANNLNIAHTNELVRNHYNHECDRVFADGSGVNLGAKLTSQRVEDNVNGTDLLPIICEFAEKEEVSLFLLGAAPGTAERMSINLKTRYSGLKIVGTHHGYIDDELSCKRAIRDINSSKADLLLVAMGTPLQESWLSENLSRIKCPVKVSVGGLFDFYAGNVKRAPLFFRKLGCEWIWRIIQEPKRLWKRYILGNPLFLYRVIAEKLCKGGDDNADVGIARSFFGLTNKWLSVKLKAFRFMKRGIDIAASLILLTSLMPMFLVLAIMIKLDSKGTVLYSQDRVGKGGRLFKFWKFRSMVSDSDAKLQELTKSNESLGKVLFKMKSDPRVTPVGGFIRKYSIDELPQLWNVLKGDMSLVGPRPCLPTELEKYAVSDRVRLAVKPGITCLWQVGGRSDLSFKQQMFLDKKYIRERSLSNDVKILLLTIPAVLSGKGAY